ncbi:hypothetical protein O181_085265 [Austropuccinia psidii MF-1]|uniref:Phosphoglycerate mutase n=1 Tax=Austropuccinia psidii MF-1 TaxID=1389203 RepID=A0A9Q3FRV4_9BASI|nr:hypothetical protein [Austropuccinia psidii MF-1]
MTVLREIFLLRHGQTDDNKNQIIQGQRDSELNESGIQQAKLTGQFFKKKQIQSHHNGIHNNEKGFSFDEIWSSDLKRAHKTAEIVAKELNQPPNLIKTDKRLRERYLGDLEGKPRGSVVDRSNAEPAHKVLDRLLDFWKTELAIQNINQNDDSNDCKPSKDRQLNYDTRIPRRILVVSHGAALRSLIYSGLVGTLQYQISQDQLSIPIGNCSITLIHVTLSHHANQIVSVAHSSHLSALNVNKQLNTNADDDEIKTNPLVHESK